MLFWTVAALLTLGATLAVLLPLARRDGPARADGDHDLEVYRDQLAELERDAERGLIQPAEAEQARAEIARRIIRTDAERREAQAGTRQRAAARWLSAAAVLAVPLLGWGIYGVLGSPDLPSQPLEARLSRNPAESSIEELVARAEGHLAANPEDGRGWDVLAPIYMRTGRFAEAVNAYRNALRLQGASAAREAGLGEAIAAAGGGMVSADARAAFERALELEPGHPKASYYLATALSQEGRVAEAIGAWEGMLETAPADSPWRGAVEQAIGEARTRLASASGEVAPGPDREQVEAAAGMSAADRDAMIEEMVAGLDERLRQNPLDVDGWTRLVRSYAVLGRTEEARSALERGVAALGPDSEDGRRLQAFAASLDLETTEQQ